MKGGTLPNLFFSFLDLGFVFYIFYIKKWKESLCQIFQKRRSLSKELCQVTIWNNSGSIFPKFETERFKLANYYQLYWAGVSNICFPRTYISWQMCGRNISGKVEFHRPTKKRYLAGRYLFINIWTLLINI